MTKKRIFIPCEKIGIFEVQHEIKKEKTRRILVKCTRCGKKSEISMGALLNNNQKSCRYCKSDYMTKYHEKQIIGKRFGLLTVKKLYVDNGVRKVECQCACGNIHITKLYSITNGLARSCGCLRREEMREKLRLMDKKKTKKITDHEQRANGKRCSLCGVIFTKTDGKPVICYDCYKYLTYKIGEKKIKFNISQYKEIGV